MKSNDSMNRTEARGYVSMTKNRLLDNMKQYQVEFNGVVKPTEDQIAWVMRALADHTMIQIAQRYRPDPTSPWPAATSQGRWYLDMRDVLGERYGKI